MDRVPTSEADHITFPQVTLHSEHGIEHMG
jgi:hypothetical protein